MEDLFLFMVIGLIVIVTSPFIVKHIVTISCAAYFEQKLRYHRKLMDHINQGENHHGAQ